MAYKPRVLTVPEGGLGVATHTAYVPICGGTTSTGNTQDLASIGSSGQALTSNGAGVLPTFQNLPSGSGKGYIFYACVANGNPADSTTYYFTLANQLFTFTVTTGAYFRFYTPVDGTVNTVYARFRVGGTLGSAQNCTLALRKNNTTDFNITTTLQLTAADVSVNTTSLGMSLVAGDYFSIKFVGPAWSANPTTVSASVAVLLT